MVNPKQGQQGQQGNPQGLRDLEQKAKMLDRACQKLESDLHKKSIDAKTLHKDCQEISRLSEECENCSKRIR